MIIRTEKSEDYQAAYRVNVKAFGRSAEADLVKILRKEASPNISLVAIEDGKVVGHILFTPVTLSGHAGLKIMGLGPMAVLPGYQGKGFGSALVIGGLEKSREIGYGAVVVLVHPWFYLRFGFVPSKNFGITCEDNVKPEVFMVLELLPEYLLGVVGLIRYHAAFAGV
jgi:putative acetyltransferase